VKFYDNLDAGYAALVSPVIRRVAMKGYAMGLTFNETKKWLLLLPLAPIRESVLKLTQQRMGGEAKRPNILMGKPICSNQV